MRILFLGDIVGKPGYSAVLKHAEAVRAKEKLDALVVNAENASEDTALKSHSATQLPTKNLQDWLAMKKRVVLWEQPCHAIASC